MPTEMVRTKALMTASDCSDLIGVVDIGEFLRGIAKKALEERVQPSNSTLSFGEYFDGLEQQLNDRIRLLVTRISALLQGDPEQAGSPPGSPQLRGQDFHVR